MTNVGILTKHATTLAEFLYKKQTRVTGTLLANKKRCTHSPQEYQQLLLTTKEGMEAPNSSLNHVQQAHGRGGHTGSYRLTLRQAKDLSLSFGNTGWHCCTNFIRYNNNCPIPIWIYVNFILRDLMLNYLQKIQISTGLWCFQGSSKRTLWTVPGDLKTACTHCLGCQVGVHLKCFELITWTQHQ